MTEPSGMINLTTSLYRKLALFVVELTSIIDTRTPPCGVLVSSEKLLAFKTETSVISTLEYVTFKFKGTVVGPPEPGVFPLPPVVAMLVGVLPLEIFCCPLEVFPF